MITLQHKRGTAANWTLRNPILAQGEFGLETDTNKFKIGDGVTVWSSLAYFGSSGSQVFTNSPTDTASPAVKIFTGAFGVYGPPAAALFIDATGSSLWEGAPPMVVRSYGGDVTFDENGGLNVAGGLGAGPNGISSLGTIYAAGLATLAGGAAITGAVTAGAITATSVTTTGTVTATQVNAPNILNPFLLMGA